MENTTQQAAGAAPQIPAADVRTGTSVPALKQAILDNLRYLQARLPQIATRNDWYMALAHAARDRLMRRWLESIPHLADARLKIVGYLSAEFLMGPHLDNCLLNLGIEEPVRQALQELGQNLDDLLAQEEEPGLGNGGLGRLAACYLDSLSTLGVPAIGYGIRYEFGIFDQEIRDGWQVEKTDKWLRLGNPWEIPRPEIAFQVNLGGRTEAATDEKGNYRVKWVPARVVKGVAYDTPVAGFGRNHANILRLWKSEAIESFDFQAFNVGNYYDAVDEKVQSETISKVLYPNDEAEAGKKLRLAQQYFFVSCSLQDAIRIHQMRGLPIEKLPESFALQLNDTHPSIAVAELMRLLIDVHFLDWDTAWGITRDTFGYTNHTLLPEALEKWPMPMLGQILPRHLEIIFEINRRFLDQVYERYPKDGGRIARLSIIDEQGSKYVRMANLASIGSHAINGVAALHSELLKKDVLRDFAELWPDKFLNVTNGVTPRRWLALSNPRLSALITRRIGDRWIGDFEGQIGAIEKFAEEEEFRKEWREAKAHNKRRLAALIKERTGTVVDPASLFDVQVKRIHEYKRQHLNILHVIALYNRLKKDPGLKLPPRTVIFGGKAAPGYFIAKRIIKLINSVAEVVNADPDVRDRLKVVFFPDFNVKNAQCVYPGADVSEQISTAGKEASGTGNMKFAMNGALTVGTLDGANVEIREAVGAENFFLFGLTVEEIEALRQSGYRPRDRYDATPDLREALDQISSGVFSKGDRFLFAPIVDPLLERDEYLLLADYRSYVECQDRVAAAYLDQERWTRMSIRNVARCGKFSSDRAIREYCEKVWKAFPVDRRTGGSA